MDLILWRHADAEDGPDFSPPTSGLSLAGPSNVVDADLHRCLSARGHKQSSRMAKWVDRTLTNSARVLVSPAMRCEQTVVALGRKYKTCPELAPWASVDDLLGLVHWPSAKLPVLVVGHQPTLGLVVTRLLGVDGDELSFRKGAIWWLRSRERDGQIQTVVVTVQSPEFL
jgi:phosphohistidine phosphatase